MMATIKSPITFYANAVVIDQTGHSKELFDYYWTAHSRGTDGAQNDPLVNNIYLDGYSTLRAKSIYDPCPYSYRTPTNGTYNQFPTTYPTWTNYSYIGGAKFTPSTNSTWFPSTGRRYWQTGLFYNVGSVIGYYTATAYAATHGYALRFDFNNTVYINDGWRRSEGLTIRCIEAIKSPITYYAGDNNVVINQSGHTKELFDYYWTAYSRGTDGTGSNPLLNNTYLDGYSTLRTKSIYDPCPYSYRTPTNGTYNQFPKTYPKWTQYSYIGGAKWTFSTNSTWFPNTGRREWQAGLFTEVGHVIGYRTATANSATNGYVLRFDYNNIVYPNDGWLRSHGFPIRCIEDCASLALLLLRASCG